MSPPSDAPARPGGRRRLLALLGLGGLLAVAALAVTQVLRGPDPTALSDPSDPERVALGEALYAEHCASCHGAALEGHPEWDTWSGPAPAPAPPHDATGHTWHHGDRLLFDYVKHGGEAVAKGLGITGHVSGMPGFAETLTDAEIGAVLAFIKTSWPPRLAAYQREVTAAEAE